MNPVRILIADDHALVVAGLRSLLEEIDVQDVVGMTHGLSIFPGELVRPRGFACAGPRNVRADADSSYRLAGATLMGIKPPRSYLRG